MLKVAQVFDVKTPAAAAAGRGPRGRALVGHLFGDGGFEMGVGDCFAAIAHRKQGSFVDLDEDFECNTTQWRRLNTGGIRIKKLRSRRRCT